MTVLEANQAYRAAMQILWVSRIKVAEEHDDVAHALICRAQDHLTEQEHKDMKASFGQ